MAVAGDYSSILVPTVAGRNGSGRKSDADLAALPRVIGSLEP